MPIKVKCKQCDHTLTAPDSVLGRKGKCPNCGIILEIVPDLSGSKPSPMEELEAALDGGDQSPSTQKEVSPDDSVFAIPVVPPKPKPKQKCPACKTASPQGTTICPGCGYNFATGEYPVSDSEGDLDALTAAVNGEAATSDTEASIIELEPEDDEEIEEAVRDRIVVLGRRAAGKTVYLSVLYDRLWNSRDGLAMRALSGPAHSDLIRTAANLRKAKWPAATLETQHLDIELEYKGTKRMLVALDYAGELFRRVFVEDKTESEEAATLLNHLDHATAVIILMDPHVAISGDIDARTDDDFGICQAISRIQNWPGGETVPVVLVFTKADVSNRIIKEHGGLAAFVKTQYPALARTLKRVRLFQVSAVQTMQDGNGNIVPRPDSNSDHVELPLRYCLGELSRREEEERRQELRRMHKETVRVNAKAEREKEQRLLEEAETAERESMHKTIAIILTMAAIGLIVALVAVIL